MSTDKDDNNNLHDSMAEADIEKENLNNVENISFLNPRKKLNR